VITVESAKKKILPQKNAGAAKENLIFHDVPKIPERIQRLRALSAAQ
jgi:Zn-dependent protease with chaperone function